MKLDIIACEEARPVDLYKGDLVVGRTRYTLTIRLPSGAKAKVQVPAGFYDEVIRGQMDENEPPPSGPSPSPSR
jgi:hypothetical protein